ncbi:hypothetical protein QBC47DRAFT_169700 [Echria macrotheca]|uniref:Uncharacterized protein n=1 Tax=Echria macrotheca TaxID=438768 RepID=A0AAJ0F7G3_9PEZI|nr:hypothetical protein QBC47DRAFT_169700 [Echria macrotheca]
MAGVAPAVLFLCIGRVPSTEWVRNSGMDGLILRPRTPPDSALYPQAAAGTVGCRSWVKGTRFTVAVLSIAFSSRLSLRLREEAAPGRPTVAGRGCFLCRLPKRSSFHGTDIASRYCRKCLPQIHRWRMLLCWRRRVRTLAARLHRASCHPLRAERGKAAGPQNRPRTAKPDISKMKVARGGKLSKPGLSHAYS